MKPILLVTLVLAIITLAIVGCLTIFGIITMEAATSFLIKAEAVIILLGGCSAVISLLVGGANKNPQE